MIKVGSQIYIVPEDTRTKPYYAVVKNIGNKYITVDGHPSYSRFSICTHESVDDKTGWNPKLKLYDSKFAYEQQLQYDAERKQLLENVEKLLQKCNNNILKRVYNYIKFIKL